MDGQGYRGVLVRLAFALSSRVLFHYLLWLAPPNSNFNVSWLGINLLALMRLPDSIRSFRSLRRSHMPTSLSTTQVRSRISTER